MWQNNKKIKGSPDDYVIKETEEGIFVENKKAGLIVKAPEGWEVEMVKKREGSVAIQTLDIKGGEIDGITVPPLIKGCGIETTVTYKALSFEEIKKGAEEIHWMLVPVFEEFEEIIVNGEKALKNTWESKAKGPMITVYIPTNGKVYAFTLAWTSDEKDMCVQEFESFLETISIQ